MVRLGSETVPCRVHPVVVRAHFGSACAINRRNLLRACLVLLLLSQTGCSVWQLARRSSCYEPKCYDLCKEEKRECRLYRRWANEVWANQAGSEPVPEQYYEGFISGFVDHVFSGGDGTPPAVPPRKFWRVNQRNASSNYEHWLDGFSAGATAALQGGFRQRIVMPISRDVAVARADVEARRLDGARCRGGSKRDVQMPMGVPNGGQYNFAPESTSRDRSSRPELEPIPIQPPGPKAERDFDEIDDEAVPSREPRVRRRNSGAANDVRGTSPDDEFELIEAPLETEPKRSTPEEALESFDLPAEPEDSDPFELDLEGFSQHESSAAPPQDRLSDRRSYSDIVRSSQSRSSRVATVPTREAASHARDDLANDDRAPEVDVAAVLAAAQEDVPNNQVPEEGSWSHSLDPFGDGTRDTYDTIPVLASDGDDAQTSGRSAAREPSQPSARQQTSFARQGARSGTALGQSFAAVPAVTRPAPATTAGTGGYEPTGFGQHFAPGSQLTSSQERMPIAVPATQEYHIGSATLPNGL